MIESYIPVQQGVGAGGGRRGIGESGDVEQEARESSGGGKAKGRGGGEGGREYTVLSISIAHSGTNENKYIFHLVENPIYKHVS